MTSPQANTPLSTLLTFVVGRSPRRTFLRIACLVGTTFVLFQYVILLRKIESVSMLPTFREGSIHVILRPAYAPGRPPRRGDIVGVRTSGVTVMYVKRIVGLPGETLAIRDGTVLIDGKPLDEPYVRPGRRPWNRAPRTLRPDQYFVIGDNRSMREDQHEFGAIDGARIVGKVIW